MVEWPTDSYVMYDANLHVCRSLCCAGSSCVTYSVALHTLQGAYELWLKKNICWKGYKYRSTSRDWWALYVAYQSINRMFNSWRRPPRPKRSVYWFICHIKYSSISRSWFHNVAMSLYSIINMGAELPGFLLKDCKFSGSGHFDRVGLHQLNHWTANLLHMWMQL